MREKLTNLKSNKAITLIALVITIIVLLILAGVAIATLTGDNGLLQKSTDAKNRNIDAEIEEQIRLAWNKVYMDGYLNSATDKANTLKTELEKNGYTVEDVSVKGNKITIINYRGKDKIINSSTGMVEDNKPGIGDLVTKDNYGDYIDLGQSVVGTSAKTDDWRILYNDKAGYVYAILAGFLPNTNAAVTAIGLDTTNTYYVYSNTDKDTLLAGLNHATAWQSLIPEGLRSTCQVKGATTAEILMASYNEKYGTNLNYTSSPVSYLRTNPNDDSSSIDTLYMPDNYNSAGYWLASPRVDKNGRIWALNYKGFIGNYWYNDKAVGLRPVVILPSDIQVTKNGAVWTVVQ